MLAKAALLAGVLLVTTQTTMAAWCLWGQWECNNNLQCVSNSDKCDGHSDCWDGSDETISAGCYLVTAWSLGVGSIIGIVIGVIVCIVMIVVASYFCCCRSNNRALRTTVIAPSQPATVSYISTQQHATYTRPGGYGYGPPQGPPAYGSPPAAAAYSQPGPPAYGPPPVGTAYPPPTLAPGASPYNNDPAYPPMKQ